MSGTKFIESLDWFAHWGDVVLLGWVLVSMLIGSLVLCVAIGSLLGELIWMLWAGLSFALKASTTQIMTPAEHRRERSELS